MTILTATQARADLDRSLDHTAESHTPVTIAGERNQAVLVSAEDWAAIQETLREKTLALGCDSGQPRRSSGRALRCRSPAAPFGARVNESLGQNEPDG